MKRIVGRLLQRVVVAVRGGVGFWIVDRVLAKVCLERLGGVVPARVTRQRRQSRRIVWDRASMGAAVICELEAGQLGYVNRRIGRMRSIVGLRERMKRVIGRLLQRVVVAVGGGVGLRERMKRVIGRLLQRVVGAVGGGVGLRESMKRVIGRLLQRVVVAVGGVVGLRERMKRVIGRLLQRVVVAVGGGVGGFRIVDRVMIQVCLERLGGVVPAQVARPRRRSRRVVWDLAGMGVAVISASRL